MYGNFDQLIDQPYNWKLPILLSYFPLFLYPDNHQKIPSFKGNLQTLITSVNEENSGNSFFFDQVPTSLLIHPRLQGWKSSNLKWPKGVPVISFTFNLKFDVISTLVKNTGNNIQIDQEYLLFEFSSIDLIYAHKFQIFVLINLSSVNDSTFEGNLKYTLKFYDKDGLVDSKTINISIEVSSKDPGEKKILNYSKERNPFFTTRYINLGFYQVLSPQSLVFRVSLFLSVESR